MHPPVYLLLRRVTDPYTVQSDPGTVSFDKGSEILLYVFDSQRDPSHWGGEKTGYAADAFEPDRWSSANIAQRGLTRKELDLVSFGLGPRVCMGVHLFRSEGSMISGEIQAKLKITPHFNDPETKRRSDFTLQRVGGYPVTLQSF
jgi:cytochrome P450